MSSPARPGSLARRSRSGPLACLAVGAALLLGAVALPPSAGASDVGAVPVAGEPQAAARSAAAARRAGDDRRPTVSAALPPLPAPVPAAPARVELATLGEVAPVVTVGTTDDGELVVPEDVRSVGWWAGGARLGEDGTTVLAGHVDGDSQGPGAFFRLRDLEPGDPVRVTDRRGDSHDYVVAARRQMAKQALPDEVFAQDTGPRLVLITCGGGFDEQRRHYSDNVVVYAVPAP